MSEMPGEVTAKVEMAVEAMAEMVTDAEVTDTEEVTDKEEVNAKVATTTVTVLGAIGNPDTVICIRISLKVREIVAEASELFTEMGLQVLQLPLKAMSK